MLRESKFSFRGMVRGIRDFVVPSENSQVIEMRETLRKSKEQMDDMFQSVRRSYEAIKDLSHDNGSFLPLFLASGDVQNDLNIASEKTDKISVQSCKDLFKKFSEIENDYNNACFSFANQTVQHIENANNQSIRNLFFRMRALTHRLENLLVTSKEILQNIQP